MHIFKKLLRKKYQETDYLAKGPWFTERELAHIAEHRKTFESQLPRRTTTTYHELTRGDQKIIVPHYEIQRGERSQDPRFCWVTTDQEQPLDEDEESFYLPPCYGHMPMMIGYATHKNRLYRVRDNRWTRLIPALETKEDSEKDGIFFKMGRRLGLVAQTPHYFEGLCQENNYCIDALGEVKIWAGLFNFEKRQPSAKVLIKAYFLNTNVAEVITILTKNNQVHKTKIKQGIDSVMP